MSQAKPDVKPRPRPSTFNDKARPSTSCAPRSLLGSDRGPPGPAGPSPHPWMASLRQNLHWRSGSTSDVAVPPASSAHLDRSCLDEAEPGEAPSEALRRVVLCAQEGQRHAHLAVAALDQDLRGGHREDLPIDVPPDPLEDLPGHGITLIRLSEPAALPQRQAPAGPPRPPQLGPLA